MNDQNDGADSQMGRSSARGSTSSRIKKGAVAVDVSVSLLCLEIPKRARLEYQSKLGSGDGIAESTVKHKNVF